MKARMKAVVLAGSNILVTPRLFAQTRQADLVIAADGGLRHAAPLNLSPHLIVGDFDSASPDLLARFAEVPRVQHPTDKDELDLELAVTQAVARGARDLVLVGTLGERFDQSLAAVLIAAEYARKGFSVSLHNGRQEVFLLADKGTHTFDLAAGQLFSLLGLAEVSTVNVRGARFDLEHAPLPFGVGLGVSNRVATPPLGVTLDGGLVALVVEYGLETGETKTGDAKTRVWGEKAEALEAALYTLDPDLADLVVNVAYGVFDRPGLELKTKELLAVAHLVGVGGEAELKTHLYGALNCGATPQEIKETLLHAAMFVGFPRAVTAFKVWRDVQRSLGNETGGNSSARADAS